MAQRRKLVSSHAGSFVQDQAPGGQSWPCGLSITPSASLVIPPWQPRHVSLAPVKPSWSCSTRGSRNNGQEWNKKGSCLPLPPQPQAGRSEAGIVGVKPLVLNPACSTENSPHFLPSWAPLRANVGSANGTFPRGHKGAFLLAGTQEAEDAGPRKPAHKGPGAGRGMPGRAGCQGFFRGACPRNTKRSRKCSACS